MDRQVVAIRFELRPEDLITQGKKNASVIIARVSLTFSHKQQQLYFHNVLSS